MTRPEQAPAIPVGHLAVVERAESMPADIRKCAARLAELGGPVSKATVRLMAELSRRY